MTYSSAVIGLGNVGMRYDLNSTDDDRILTHVRAYVSHPGFRLTAGVDPDQSARQVFETQYRLPAFSSTAEMLVHEKPDIVSVCSPTTQHHVSIEELLSGNYKPRAILCEKPLSNNLDTANRIRSLVESKRVPLFVNYIRRFDPAVIELREKVRSKYFGAFRKGIVLYSGGLLNNASHFIDLLIYLFPYSQIHIPNPNHQLNVRGDTHDPDFCILVDHSPIYFLSTVKADYSHLEMTLLFSEFELRYIDGGDHIEIRSAEDSSLYQGYRFLGVERTEIKTHLCNYQHNVTQSLFDYLEHGTSPPSNIESSIKTQMILDEIANNT